MLLQPSNFKGLAAKHATFDTQLEVVFPVTCPRLDENDGNFYNKRNHTPRSSTGESTCKQVTTNNQTNKNTMFLVLRVLSVFSTKYYHKAY